MIKSTPANSKRTGTSLPDVPVHDVQQVYDSAPEFVSDFWVAISQTQSQATKADLAPPSAAGRTRMGLANLKSNVRSINEYNDLAPSTAHPRQEPHSSASQNQDAISRTYILFATEGTTLKRQLAADPWRNVRDPPG